MRKILFYILFTISNLGFCQQNLVLNPSCENYISCPNSLGQTNLLMDVYNPNTNSPDFFHTCYTNSNNQAKVPGNLIGYQLPYSGDAYCGITPFYFSPEGREYLTFHLSDTLVVDKNYNVSFYISLADSMKHTTDKIGAYLHPNIIFQNDYYYLPYQPQVENSVGNFITDKINWIKIEGEYIADGGEKYITIGNFYPDSLTDTISLNSDPISGSNWAGAYFYIDDVSVTEILDTTDTVQPIDSTIFDINLFPNPNNGEFVLNYNLSEFNDGVFKIYNAIGQIVYEEKLTQNNGVRNLQLQLASGAYVWKVESGDVVLTREKMIITK